MTAIGYGPLDIPGFRLERVLGSGGFADVYLYTQELLGRSVAVKILRGQVEEGAARTQFLTEAHLMARLASHPSIVTILSAEVSEGGRPYIVMEYCSRPSLAQRYQARPLSIAEALQTMIRLSGAVETAHQAGILHRDIKPANVLTTDYGWPALTDFGISAIAGETTTGEGGMSVPWSPPEAFTGASRLDERSDVYSLAATAYTVLAGHSPFDSPAATPEMAAFVYRILESPVPEIPRPDMPGTLQRLLGVAMEKDPRNRPESAAAFARALQRIERELGLPETPFDVPDTLIDDLERTQSRIRSGDTTVGVDLPEDDLEATVIRGVASTVPRASAQPEPPHPVPEPVAPVEEAAPVEPEPVAPVEEFELEETVIVSRAAAPVAAPEPDPAVEPFEPFEPFDPDELPDETVAIPGGIEATIVVDRSLDETVVAPRPAPGVRRSPRSNLPVLSGRVAYIPDPDEIARYRARTPEPRPTPARAPFEPPPQRVAPTPLTRAKPALAPLVVGVIVTVGVVVLAVAGVLILAGVLS